VHELALADAIVAIAAEHAQGRRVARVEAAVGYLRQVVPDALAFSFELLANGTVVEGAELVLEEVPARIACPACEAETTVDSFPFACARCGGLDVQVIDGEQLQVIAIELEDELAAAVRR
jgi:hydrogenase nickel incorporation protein HypA/HybF